MIITSENLERPEYFNINILRNYVKSLRNFDTSDYLDKKLRSINYFFQREKLNAAVIGISGGIDSALTLKLLIEASKIPNSPIKKVLGLLLPIHGTGTSGQDEATRKGKLLCDNIKLENNLILDYKIIDLTIPYREYIDASKIKTSNWTKGQLASVVRMPCLYYFASILRDDYEGHNYKSLVVGTTNRDEGSYVGFFGKTSDGMVDLQPIADLHKSEVYKLAEKLNIETDIIHAPPQGDVFDGRTSEEMMEVPYWFVEMYTNILCILNTNNSSNPITYERFQKVIDLRDNFTEIEFELFQDYTEKIEKLHQFNLHKYRVGMPCHFLDIQDRKVPGGW